LILYINADNQPAQKKAAQGSKEKNQIARHGADFQYAQEPSGGDREPVQARRVRESFDYHSQKAEFSPSKNRPGAPHQWNGSDGLYSRNRA